MQVTTNKRKWTVSAIAGLLFMILISPWVVDFVTDTTSDFGLCSGNSKSYNGAGIIIMGIIFILIMRLLLL